MELTAQDLLMTGDAPPDRRKVEASEFAALIDQARSGNRAAFEEIMLRHERRVLMVALRLMGTVEDAQDAAQEVFLRTFKYLPRFDTRKPFEPWILRMTANVCRTALRKRGERRSLFTAAYEGERPDPSRGPLAHLSEEETRKQVHRALDVLTEKERAALVLRDIEGLTTGEVAQILGSSEGTVRVHISSARLKIRKAIERLKEGAR
jgi:RNA polymerase sigma-70 factor (ECF subfamily)